MVMQSEQRLAVLIDADNAAAKNLKPIMDEVAKYGVPTIKHAYGDWAKLGGWKDSLLEIGAVPVQQYAYTTGKNATDSALIIEAMDILHANNVDGFVIVLSDSDFTPLALRLRESGKIVYGIGEKKTPLPFIKACDKFIYVEILSSEGAPSAERGADGGARGGGPPVRKFRRNRCRIRTYGSSRNALRSLRGRAGSLRFPRWDR